MERALSVHKFTVYLLKLSFLSFLHRVLKVVWDDLGECAASIFIVTESGSGEYRSDYNEGIFLLYKKVRGWGGENFGHSWPQKGEEGIGLVTNQQELRVSVRDVQVVKETI